MKYKHNLTRLKLSGLLVVSLLTACGSDGSSNTAPVASDQSISLDEDAATSITLSAADAESNNLTYSISDPAHGAISGTAPDITYTPNANYYGDDSFTFSVNDGTVASETATVSIAIYPVNDLVTFQPATVVIGQADFTGTSSNQGGSVDANTISAPYGNPGVYNNILYLPDYSNNRLLGFNTIPTVNNSLADFVLGQPDFSAVNTVLSDIGFKGTQTVAFDANKMFVAEYDGNRILIWNSIPTSGGVPADIVLGQEDFITNTAGSCDTTGLSQPETVWAANGKLVVTDSEHNRVLIWNTIPTTNNVPADIVLGQQDFNHCAQNDTDNDGASDAISASTLSSPAGVWTDGTRLVVLDTNNNRTLIWNSFPTSNFAPADIVLGQSDFSSNVNNDDDQDGALDGVPTARTMSGPYDGVYSNGRQLYVADTNNNRVLIWNRFPSSNFTPADVVLGQADFTLSSRNDGDGNGVTDAANASTLSSPTGIYQSGNRLIVADEGNNRYIIYSE